MTQLDGVGNAGILGSAVMGAAATTATWADVINENAMAIGILLTLLSLIGGVVFKVIAVIQGVKIERQRREEAIAQREQSERHHREELAAQREQNQAIAEALREEIRALAPR